MTTAGPLPHDSERQHVVAARPGEVGEFEVGAARTTAWLNLFSAADVLVGLDVLADELLVVLRHYVLDLFGPPPFDS